MHPYLGTWQQTIASFIVASFFLVNASCGVYSVRASPAAHSLRVDKSKTIILHQGDRFVKLESFELEGEELKGLPGGQFQSDGEPAQRTFSSRTAQEVHLYLDETPPLVVEPGKSIVVPFSAIKKVMFYDEDKGCTTASLGGATAIGLATIGFVILLISV